MPDEGGTHQRLAVIHEFIRDHHPMVGIAGTFTEVDFFARHQQAQKSVLLPDDALRGDVLEEWGQLRVGKHGGVKIFERQAHLPALP